MPFFSEAILHRIISSLAVKKVTKQERLSQKLYIWTSSFSCQRGHHIIFLLLHTLNKFWNWIIYTNLDLNKKVFYTKIFLLHSRRHKSSAFYSTSLLLTNVVDSSRGLAFLRNPLLCSKKGSLQGKGLYNKKK